MDMESIIEQLKIFMAERDLTIENIATLIDRSPRTVWQFLHQKVKPHSRTEYRIRKLIREG